MRLALFYAVDLDDRELAGIEPEPVLRWLHPFRIEDIGIDKTGVRPGTRSYQYVAYMQFLSVRFVSHFYHCLSALDKSI